MKNSGIEWIGEIPDSWEYFRLKDYYEFEKGKNAAIYTQEYIGTHPGEFPVYSGQTENDGVMGNISSFDYDEEECLFTTTVGAKVMTPKVLNGKFSLSQNCLIMKRVKPCCNKYIFYQLFPLFDYTKSMIPTYMQPSLRISDLNTYGFFSPNEIQQRKIADYLDSKCAEVNKLIDIQQAQIDKLKEYKQSVITEAVTKGLDPTVPMKDSGVEWIGMIPEGWRVVKNKVLFQNVSIKGFGNARVLSLYRDLGVVPKDTREDNHNVTSLDTDGYKHVEINDLVINKMKAWSGSLAISDYDGIVSPAYYVCKVNYKYVDKRFIHHYLRNKHMVALYEMYSAGLRVGQWDLAIDDFLNIEIAVPDSLREQKEIAIYIDDKCAKIDKLIAIKQAKIDKLQEYKKSLIYEYVTGKKEVM